MRLLYVSSCHPVLEYNDLTLFTEMGIECFSTGIFSNPDDPVKGMIWRKDRIPKLLPDEESLGVFSRDNPTYGDTLKGYNRPRLKLSKELVKSFDVVLCNGFSHYVFDNWNSIKNKLVVWRTYGDQTDKEEGLANSLLGLKRVRSLTNEELVGNCKSGDIIHCNVDDTWFKGWLGTKDEVLSFQNAFYIRKEEKAGEVYLDIRQELSNYINFSLYGDFPDKCPMVKGQLSMQEQLHEYQNCKIYFSIGSHPATVTYNFIEAFMVGIPVVTFGYKIGGAPKGGKRHLYQVPEFIDNGNNGFCSDSRDYLIAAIKELKTSPKLRRFISENARKKAIDVWGNESVKKQWQRFFIDNGVYCGKT